MSGKKQILESVNRQKSDKDNFGLEQFLSENMDYENLSENLQLAEEYDDIPPSKSQWPGMYI